jgi:peptide/nickel transport system permease protein
MTAIPPALKANVASVPAEAMVLQRRHWRPWAPIALLAGFSGFFLLSPFVALASPNTIDFAHRLQAPGSTALLGTDTLGRDVLARLLAGGQRTLLITFLATALATLAGAGIGAAAGFAGGWLDLGVTGLLDVLLALPGLLVTLAILGVLGTGEGALLLALVGGSWAGEARVIRGAAYQARERAYIEAARSIGAGPWRLLSRHLAPSIITPIIVLASLNLAELPLIVSALNFLGLGIQPPSADWGVMLADSRPVFAQAPWLMLAPGLCLVVFSLLANLSGDALRDILDPRGTRR